MCFGKGPEGLELGLILFRKVLFYIISSFLSNGLVEDLLALGPEGRREGACCLSKTPLGTPELPGGAQLVGEHSLHPFLSSSPITSTPSSSCDRNRSICFCTYVESYITSPPHFICSRCATPSPCPFSRDLNDLLSQYNAETKCDCSSSFLVHNSLEMRYVSPGSMFIQHPLPTIYCK